MKVDEGFWKGLEVTIQGAHGVPLPEYEYDQPQVSAQSKKHAHSGETKGWDISHAQYVECEPGKRFTICIRRPPRSTYGIHIDLFADGHPLLLRQLLLGDWRDVTLRCFNKANGDDAAGRYLAFSMPGRNDSAGEQVNVQDSVSTPNGSPGTLVLHLKAGATVARGEKGLETFVTGEITKEPFIQDVYDFVSLPSPTSRVCFVYRTRKGLADLGVITGPRADSRLSIIPAQMPVPAAEGTGADGVRTTVSPSQKRMAEAEGSLEGRPPKRRVTVTVEYIVDEEGNRHMVEQTEVQSDVIDLTMEDD